MKPNHKALYLSAFLGAAVWLLLLWISVEKQASWYSYGSDYWEYAATINAWMQDFLNPANHRFDIDAGSIRNTPYFAVVVLLSSFLGLNAIQAMSLSGVLASPVFVVAVPLFANRYYRNPWAGSAALVIFLCGWGLQVMQSCSLALLSL